MDRNAEEILAVLETMTDMQLLRFIKIVNAASAVPVPSASDKPAPAQPVVVLPDSGNPYALTEERVKIVPDGRLFLVAPSVEGLYLQSRWWHVLWNIAGDMGMALTVVQACLLDGTPVGNPTHYPEGRTVDLRYPGQYEIRADLIRRLLELIPVYTTYNEKITDDAECRIDPTIKADLSPLTIGWDARLREFWDGGEFAAKVQPDPTGNHDTHMHVVFCRLREGYR